MRLALLLAAVFGCGLLAGCTEAPPDSPEKVLEVSMTAGRYFFEPGTAQPLAIPLGTTVVLRLTSTDVTHGFSILEYGVNEEVPPGQVVEVRFRADRAGDFTIFCTVFCGSGHPQHKGTLRVA